MSMLMFSVPKPFVGQQAQIQRNAIKSWTLLADVQVVLFVDEEEVSQLEDIPGVRTLPIEKVNQFGTPCLKTIFKTIHESFEQELLCYVNADIVLGEDFLRAVKGLNFERFLMVGDRLNMDVPAELNINNRDEVNHLQSLADEEGVTSGLVGSDYFCFTRASGFESIPPFLVGRAAWDNWMMFRARELGIPLVDASDYVTAVHQNHDYPHIVRNDDSITNPIDVWDGPESREQRALVGKRYFDLRHASHRIDHNGIAQRVPFCDFAYSEELVYKRKFPLRSARGLLMRIVVRMPFLVKNRFGVYRSRY